MDSASKHIISQNGKEESGANRYKRTLLLINIVCFILFWGLSVFHPHYSQDDYSLYYSQSTIGGGLSRISMRPVVGLSYWLLSKLKINVVRDQVLLGSILLAVFVFSSTELTLLFTKKMNKTDDAKSIALLNLGSLFLFGNVFVCDWMYFAEAYIQWFLAVMGMTLSIIYLSRESHLLRNSICAFIFLLVAVGSYQVIIIHYAAIALFMVYVEQDERINARTMIKILRVAMIAVSAMVCNIIISKPIGIILGCSSGSSRMVLEMEQIYVNIKLFIENQYRIWINGMGALPKASMLIVFLILSAYILYRKKKLLHLMWIIVIFFAVEGMIMVLIVMQGTYWSASRIFVPIFLIFTLLIWMNIYTQEDQQGRYTNIVYLTAVVFLIVNFIEIQINSLDVIKTNTIDQENIRQIDARIQSYENETGIQIAKIGFLSDASSSYFYNEILFNKIVNELACDYCQRALTTSWSDCNSIRYYTGRELVRVEVPEPYMTQFESMDWTVLQLDEQMVFDNDAVYIAIY